jgi:hypothetical protein
MNTLPYEKIVDCDINAMNEVDTQNWIMLGDSIFTSLYTIRNTNIIIDKTTSNKQLINYIKNMKQGIELKFIDLSILKLDHIKICDSKIEKINDYQFKFIIVLQPLPEIERMPWSKYSVIKDIGIDGINFVTGEQKLEQTIKLLLSIQQGEIPYYTSASNIFKICNTYYNNQTLANILIKFDIAETLMSKSDSTVNGKVNLRVPCLEDIESILITDIKQNSCHCKIKFNVNQGKTYEYDFDLNWPKDKLET